MRNFLFSHKGKLEHFKGSIAHIHVCVPLILRNGNEAVSRSDHANHDKERRRQEVPTLGTVHRERVQGDSIMKAMEERRLEK